MGRGASLAALAFGALPAGCCRSSGPFDDASRPAELFLFYEDPGRPGAKLHLFVKPHSCEKLPEGTTADVNGQPMKLESRGGERSLGGQGKSVGIDCSQGSFSVAPAPTGILTFRVRSGGKDATLRTTMPVTPLSFRWVSPTSPRPMKPGQTVELELTGAPRFDMTRIYLDKNPAAGDRLALMADQFSIEGTRLRFKVPEPVAAAGERTQTVYLGLVAQVPAEATGSRGKTQVTAELDVPLPIAP